MPTVRPQAAEVARLKAEGVRPSEIAVRLGIGWQARIENWVGGVRAGMRLPARQSVEQIHWP